MANIVLLLAILSAAASFVGFTAANSATNWANGICSNAAILCQYPQQMAYAAGGLAGFWLLIKIVSALRD